QRTAHGELARGLPARTVVAAIVRVAAVGDDRDTALARNRREVRVQLVFAVVTPVRGVGAALRTRHFGGLDDEVIEAELPGKTKREGAVAFGIARAVGRDRERAGAERAVGRVRQVRAVDAAAVRDDERGQPAQRGVQHGALAFERHGVTTRNRFARE